MKPCRICGGLFEPKPHQVKRSDFACNPCRAKVQRDYARERGDLSPLPCFTCGEKAEAHHASYALPLGVTWLCKQHHEEVHHETAKIYAMPKSKTQKRGRGRPAIPGRFVVVKLDERLIAKAEKLGDGKTAAGIREALERVKVG
jgi:hypothetical protein